jgi:hypothetical protein
MQLRPSAVACVLAAALCPAPFVNAQTNDGAALTLDEALLLARSNNRDLKQFGLDVGKQRETLGEAKTHLYPRFDTFVLAAQLFRQSPGISVLRDDWSPDSPQMKIEIDPDRANLVSITNADVATSTAAAISGSQVGIFKEGNKNIPIVVRLRPQDRARLSQIENLYVNSSQENVKVPLLSVAILKNILETARIRRREHFLTLSILCFPAPGVLASKVLAPIEPKLNALKNSSRRAINCRLVARRQNRSRDSRISRWFF